VKRSIGLWNLRVAARCWPIIAASCAGTSITSMISPEVRGRTYHRVLVVFPLQDLRERQTAENEFRASYSHDSTVFLPSYQVFFPGRQYTPEEVKRLLSTNGVDAALVISLSDAGASRHRTANQTTAQCTLWSSSQGCVQATATTNGGYDISKPWASFTAQLLDASNGQVMWTASARTGGNAFANARTLLKSMAHRTVTQLQTDGVVP